MTAQTLSRVTCFPVGPANLRIYFVLRYRNEELVIVTSIIVNHVRDVVAESAVFVFTKLNRLNPQQHRFEPDICAVSAITRRSATNVHIKYISE